MGKAAGYDNLLVADIYDQIPAYRGRPDVDFYVELAVDVGGRVLEVGCGTGRVLIPTAKAGLRVDGLDASEEMLSVLRRRLLDEDEELRSRVGTIDCQNIASLALQDGTYDFVSIPYRTFQFLTTVQAQLKCLAQIRATLRTGGMIAFDLFEFDIQSLPMVGQWQDPEESFLLEDGSVVSRQKVVKAWDPVSQTLESAVKFVVERERGHSEEHVLQHTVRYSSAFEVEHLLHRSGFRLANLYGAFDRSPRSVDSYELIVVAVAVD